jgi:two-component sensor histidine kinase
MGIARSRVFRAAALFLAAALASRGWAEPSHEKPAAEAARILLLQSHYQGYAWTDSITKGVMETLAGSARPVELSVAYLDSRRTFDRAYEDAFVSYLETRFSPSQRFDLIIAGDNEALYFVVAHRQGVLGGAPVVFCGINAFSKGMLGDLAEATGITEDADMLPAMIAALDLRPQARKVAVFLSSNATGDALKEQFSKEVEEPLRGRLECRYYQGLPLEAMCGTAKGLADDTIGVFLNLTRDAEGTTIDPIEAAERISAASPVPFFSFWEIYLQHGILGGRMISGQAQGEDAAALALRILAGARASSLPVMRGRTSPFVFVWSQMQRFHVKESSLPPGSTIVGRPDSFWYRHATVLMVSGAIIALLVVFLAILLTLFSRARKAELDLKESEASLQVSLGEKEILIREIHHRVKNNLQIVASILSLGKGRGTGSETDAALLAARHRIETMAYVHEELYESEDKSRVDFMALLDRIVCRLRDSLCPPGVELQYPLARHFPLDIDRAFPLGLIVEELVSNALVHAFVGRHSGLVELSIVEEAGKLRLSVTDDGIGHPEGFDAARSGSVGYSIIYALASQLGADFTLDSGPGGSRACLALPLPALPEVAKLPIA